MIVAPPIEHDAEGFSEYELDPAYQPAEQAPAEVVLADIRHELRNIRYLIQVLVDALAAERTG